jgi:hypothetical protein
MKIRFLGVLALLLATALPVSAADLVGSWTAEFDTPIGVQKYVYVFKKSGDVLTGEATYEHSMGKGTVPLKDVKVDGDKVTFRESQPFEGGELLITYSGKLAGDEIKFTRVVGDFGTNELTAKRVVVTK